MNPLGSNTILTFGRYRGFKLIFVPSIYLFWLSERVKSDSMKNTLIEIATFNRLKEARQKEPYDSPSDFAIEMSEGYMKLVTIKKTTYNGTRKLP